MRYKQHSNPTSHAASLLGRIKSPAKAAAARENGRKGGRPRKDGSPSSASPRVIVATIYNEIDSQNRQLVWYMFSDGSAETSELSRHLCSSGAVRQTYHKVHPAGSPEARAIAVIVKNNLK